MKKRNWFLVLAVGSTIAGIYCISITPEVHRELTTLSLCLGMISMGLLSFWLSAKDDERSKEINGIYMDMGMIKGYLESQRSRGESSQVPKANVEYH